MITCPECGEEPHAHIQQKLETAEERVETLKVALTHILEYWNGNESPGAMRDALDHIMDVADRALINTKETP